MMATMAVFKLFLASTMVMMLGIDLAIGSPSKLEQMRPSKTQQIGAANSEGLTTAFKLPYVEYHSGDEVDTNRRRNFCDCPDGQYSNGRCRKYKICKKCGCNDGQENRDCGNPRASPGTCHDCKIGQYKNDNGKCTQCNTGSYQDKVKQNSCKPCPAGQYQDLLGQGSCEKCPAGQYQDLLGQGSCKHCPLGHYQDDTGQPTCKMCSISECNAGEYRKSCGGSNPGTCHKCIECSPGQYNPGCSNFESGKCIDCPLGHYQDGRGCTPCPAGHYQIMTGQTSCKECPVGHFQDKTGRTTCTACSQGEYQADKGQESCKLCEVGTYQNEEGKTSCEPCKTGSFQHWLGQPECYPCDIGTFQNEPGAIFCKSCSAGTYQNASGQESCVECAKGDFQLSKGQSECFKSFPSSCPPGYFFSNHPEIQQCISCPMGSKNTKETFGLLSASLEERCGEGPSNSILSSFRYVCKLGYCENSDTQKILECVPCEETLQ